MPQRDRILIVDDQEDNRLVIEDMLRRLRCETHHAESGEEALALLQAWRPDLILMDQMMPGMSGVEATARIKKLPDVDQVPILMVTAKSDTATLQDAFDAGAVDYIVKPIDAVTLTARVRSALRTRHAFEEIRHLTRDLMVQKQELSNFTHMVSHDLKSPVVGAASLYNLFMFRLKDEYPEVWGEPDFRELLDRIPATFQKMLRFIDTLLAYAEAGQVIGELEPTDMNRVVNMVVQNFEFAVREGIATIEWDRSFPEVECDSIRVAQVWQNLIANAIKYRGKQDPVCIQLGYESHPGEHRFWVQDNGPGIPEDNRERIFEPFVRGEESVEGRGIGLATVSRVLVAHGGQVWVDPEYQPGARFTFTLPIRDGL